MRRLRSIAQSGLRVCFWVVLATIGTASACLCSLFGVMAITVVMGDREESLSWIALLSPLLISCIPASVLIARKIALHGQSSTRFNWKVWSFWFLLCASSYGVILAAMIYSVCG